MGYKQKPNETDEEFADRKRRGTEAAREKALEKKRLQKQEKEALRASNTEIKEPADEPDTPKVDEQSALDTKRDDNIKNIEKEDEQSFDVEDIEDELLSEPDEPEPSSSDDEKKPEKKVEKKRPAKIITDKPKKKKKEKTPPSSPSDSSDDDVPKKKPTKAIEKVNREVFNFRGAQFG